MLTGAPASYARAFAHDNGIPFVPLTMMRAGTENTQVFLRISQSGHSEILDYEEISGEPDIGPQWRPLGDIIAEFNEQLAANHLIGRAPPTCA